MRRVIVVGLDGATFDVLGPLMEQGHLPNLKRLTETGVWGKLRTVIPPGTGPAWSSIVTGLDPSNHGVFDLIVRAEDSYNLAFLNASSLRAATVWDLVGGFGGKVLVLNVPMTYPPREVGGYMVSGLLTPLDSDQCTYPRDLIDKIRSIDPDYRIVPTRTYSPGRPGPFLGDVERVLDSKAEVMKHLMGELDWQFMMQVFNETDFLQHALWHVTDPGHPRHDPGEHQSCAGRITKFYERVDAVIGDMIRSAGEDTSLVVLSDHGHGPLYEFIHANNLFLREGIMKVRRSFLSRLKYMLFRLGLTPLNVYRMGNSLGLGRLRMGLRWTSKGYRMLSRLFFSFSDIDWERSAAYAISGGVYGGVFLNLRGREPAGAVDRSDYEETRTRVAGVLSRLKHPADGKPLVQKVLRREEVYSGQFTEEAPDLLFLPRDPSIGIFGDFEFSSNQVLEPASTAISAQHRMEGVFLAAGPGLRQGQEIEGLRVIDVAPALLHMMGLPIPEGLDGELREDVFLKEEMKKRPPAYFDLEEIMGDSHGGRKSMEDESIKKRLRGLGYIS
jgi:predicted AlkP superfamily phosphohydrolase/phosphomutase